MPKFQQNHLAVGHWAPRPHQYVVDQQLAARVRVLLQDKMLTMGRPMYLYTVVDESTAGSVACTCDKETTVTADFKCAGCHGARRQPGFLRFLHETLFWSSAEFASFTLVNVERDLTRKPNRLRLTAGSLTGTITTQDKAYANDPARDWTFEVAAYRKTAGDAITAEFSTNAGGTWFDLTTINQAGRRPEGTGTLRLRITLTRLAATTISPDYEIARLRHVQAGRLALAQERTDAPEGSILTLRTWTIEHALRAAFGRQTEWSADKLWMLPLDFYDNTITPDTAAARLLDRGAGPHPFVEHAIGTDQGARLALYRLSTNEQFGLLTHIAAFDRRIQPNESTSQVF